MRKLGEVPGKKEFALISPAVDYMLVIDVSPIISQRI